MTYTGQYGNDEVKFTPQQVLCDAAKKVKIKTFTRENAMFKKLKLNRFFPANEFLAGRSFNTCAVVTSAGSLKGARLGEFIDAHELVLRFNNAPTAEHARDVGKKTSIRVVNSQVQCCRI